MKIPKYHSSPGDDFSRSSRRAQNRLVLCEQDAEGRVTRQNRRCLAFCGRRIGERCRDGCKALLEGADPRDLQVRENALVRGECVDLAEVRVGAKTFVVIEFHAQRYRKQFAELASFKLTPAEERVVRMKIAGFSVAKMARALLVARTTVKTHLLHAYQKLPPELARKIQRLR